jgi:cytoskeletal protein CcmA (bactofilin family)
MLFKVYLGGIKMNRHISVFAIIFTLFLILINPVSAFIVLEPGQTVDVDTIIDDDIYICGDNVAIKGTVLGDVMVIAGRVDITGNVTGDVMAFGNKVVINGRVGDDVRVFAGRLIVNGHIGDDLMVGAGDIIVSDSADIKGDVAFGCGQMELMGDVDGNIKGGADKIILSGNVGGDVKLDSEDLNILPGAHISGNLTYSGPNEVTIPSDVVEKSVTFNEKAVSKENGIDAYSILCWLINYFSLLVIGLLFITLLPNRSEAIINDISERPLMKIIAGFVLFSAMFIGSILLFCTVVGIPLGVLLLFMISALMYGARVFFGLWLGKAIFSRLGKESKPWMEMVLGLFVLLILTSLPWIGFLIYLLVSFIAIGAIYSEKKRFYKELRDKGML